MKKTLILFILIQLSAKAQFSEESFHIWTKYSIGKIDSTTYNNSSIGFEFLLGNRLGLNYNFDFMFRKDRIQQLHSSAGLIGGPALIGLGILSWTGAKDEDGDGEKDSNLGAIGVIGGLLVLVLPEGVSYHIPIKTNWDIAPYANVLGIDWVNNRNTNLKYLRYAATFGTKFTYWNSKRYTISGFFETRKIAGMNWSLGGGLGVGMTF